MRRLADLHSVELPALEDAFDVALPAGAREDEHPLLRFAEHHLVRRHTLGAARDDVDIDAHAHAALGRHLARRAGEARGAEILDRLDRVHGDEFERRLHEELFEERIAHLHRRPLRVVSRTELERREQRCAGDAIAAGVRSDEVHRAPRTSRVREAQAVALDEADAHRVHEGVVLVAALERYVARDVGDADAVAVRTDTADDAADQAPCARGLGCPEAERVQQRDRARAHREDVAEDPTDTGGRALIRLDGARVVVALDLERAQQAAADIYRAGVLARTDRDARPSRRQRAQQLLRMLVRTVFAPHRAEHCPLERVRLAADELAHADGLEWCEADLSRDVVLRLRRLRPRDQRGRAHASVPAPRNRSI